MKDICEPKLCVCGHPATSHKPTSHGFDFGGPGAVIKLDGICKEAHPNGPYPCWGFTAPEDVKKGPGPYFEFKKGDFRIYGPTARGDNDVKQKTATEVLAASKITDHGHSRHEYCGTCNALLHDAMVLAEQWQSNNNRALLQLTLEIERNVKCREINKRLSREVDELEKWKHQAMSVMPDYQAIGTELGLVIGDTVHDKILGALKGRASALAQMRATMNFTARIPEAAARNELAAVRLLLKLHDGESVIEYLRQATSWLERKEKA